MYSGHDLSERSPADCPSLSCRREQSVSLLLICPPLNAAIREHGVRHGVVHLQLEVHKRCGCRERPGGTLPKSEFVRLLFHERFRRRLCLTSCNVNHRSRHFTMRLSCLNIQSGHRKRTSQTSQSWCIVASGFLECSLRGASTRFPSDCSPVSSTEEAQTTRMPGGFARPVPCPLQAPLYACTRVREI